MAKRRPSPDSLEQRRRLLDRCWQDECDIDPLILRARLLRHQGHRLLAQGLEQEVTPLF